MRIQCGFSADYRTQKEDKSYAEDAEQCNFLILLLRLLRNLCDLCVR